MIGIATVEARSAHRNDAIAPYREPSFAAAFEVSFDACSNPKLSGSDLSLVTCWKRNLAIASQLVGDGDRKRAERQG